MQGDLYIGRDNTRGAMNGDRAIARITHSGPNGRSEGEIVKVLKRAHPTVVGQFRINRRGYVRRASRRTADGVDRNRRRHGDPRSPLPGKRRPTASGRSRSRYPDISQMDGMIVNAEVLDYGDRKGPPVGRVIEILGAPDDFGIDVEIIIRKHHLPNRFPLRSDRRSAIDSVTSSRAAEMRGRRDFRDLPIVTIDGETARDFDDAVLVDKLPNGHYALQVHIADVSHYVTPGSAIDAEARLRGTSVYFPDRAVPMLPFELSTNICSLVPHADRLVLSALIEFDRTASR